jgi:hypothetical protein
MCRLIPLLNLLPIFTLSPDAVVLWDWVISLSREWRYVCAIPTPFPKSGSFWLPGMEDPLDAGQICVPVLPVSIRYGSAQPGSNLSSYRYWVIAVVPYLLYCFAMDHSKETCLKIYRVSTFCTFLPNVTKSLPRFQSPWLCGIRSDQNVCFHFLTFLSD